MADEGDTAYAVRPGTVGFTQTGKGWNMEFRLTITKLDFDAFANRAGRDAEIARLLHVAADRVGRASRPFGSKLRDINGNVVGRFILTEEED